jgi:hypothetical protein
LQEVQKRFNKLADDELDGQGADPVQVEAADEQGAEQVVQASDVKLYQVTLGHFFRTLKLVITSRMADFARILTMIY